jgi:hypothetical protein
MTTHLVLQTVLIPKDELNNFRPSMDREIASPKNYPAFFHQNISQFNHNQQVIAGNAANLNAAHLEPGNSKCP